MGLIEEIGYTETEHQGAHHVSCVCSSAFFSSLIRKQICLIEYPDGDLNNKSEHPEKE
jgi:hypothetical protein